MPEQDRQDLTVVGQPLVKVDAAAKVTGQTVFADDLVLPRMGFARLLRSPHPHARIRSIDVSRAAAYPGVLATLVGSELPIPFGILPVSQDEHALCLDKTRFVGDPVAAPSHRFVKGGPLAHKTAFRRRAAGPTMKARKENGHAKQTQPRPLSPLGH